MFYFAKKFCKSGYYLLLCTTAFTAGGIIHTKIRLSVCLSVRLSVKHVNYDKTKETYANILIPYKRSIHLVLRHEKWLASDDLLYMKCWATLTPFLQKRRFSIDFRS